MARIAKVFQEARLFAESEKNLKKIQDWLDQQDQEFRAVAYEGASMALGIQSMMNSGKMDFWFETSRQLNQDFEAHISIGLGWALARSRMDIPDVLNQLSFNMAWRASDGWAYHDSMFRKKVALLQKVYPENLPDKYQSAYDQGIGRSIWYDSKTDLHKVKSVVESFEEERREALWTGVGLAATFVGGMEYEDYRDLLRASGSFHWQVKTGIGLVAYGRQRTRSMNEWTQKASQCILGITANQVAALVAEQLDQKDNGSPQLHEDWITAIYGALKEV